MKRSMKVIATMVSCMLIAGTMGGCKSKETATGEKSEKSDSKKVTVTYMTWESPEMNEKIKKALEEFEKENPDIKTELVPSPLKDYGIKLKEMLIAKSAPDIFMVGNDVAIQLGKEGALLDYKPLADKESGFLDKFYPGVVSNYMVDGKLYGMPGLLNYFGIFYNKKLFKEANIPLPTNDWTYQDMFNAAEKLTKKDQKMYGLYNAAPDPFDIGIYSVSAGGEGFADAIYPITKVQACSQYKEGMKLWQKYINNGSVVPSSQKVENLTAVFMQGKVPMMCKGQWTADELIRNAPKELEWGYVTFPKVNTQVVGYDCVGWASPKDVHDPEAVFKVLKYIDTKVYEKVLYDTPVAPTAYQDSAKAYYNKLKESGHSDMAEALDYALKCPNKQATKFMDTWADKAYKFIDADWSNMIEGKTPIEKVDEMVKNINDVIK